MSISRNINAWECVILSPFQHGIYICATKLCTCVWLRGCLLISCVMCVMCTAQAAPSCLWEQRSHAKVCIQHLPSKFSYPDHEFLEFIYILVMNLCLISFLKPFCHAGPNTSAVFALEIFQEVYTDQ